jgi:hypothetical protein
MDGDPLYAHAFRLAVQINRVGARACESSALYSRAPQVASIFRQVAREKRRHSGVYVEAFLGRANGKAA